MNIPYLPLQQVTDSHAEEIQRAVARVVASGWYLKGEETKSFEQEFAAYTGMNRCVACAKGLDALSLILRSYMEMGMLSCGDEVIVPANTYIASMLAISECGLRPVPVEPRLDTFQIDDEKIVSYITPHTKALMLVHLYGYNAYTERIGQICQQYNLLLIEDCAQAHGNVKLHKELRGACAYSFYPGKNLGALGDAGCVVTDDIVLAETFEALGNYGSDKKYVFKYKGVNSRMDEIQAAVLRVKLRYLDSDNARRRAIAQRYIKEIQNKNVVLPPQDGVFHIFAVLSANREQLRNYLERYGIHTMIHYPIPPHKQQAYSEWASMSMPVTEQIHREELSLPCNPVMTDDEVTYVISVINSFQAE